MAKKKATDPKEQPEELPPCQCFQDPNDGQWYCFVLQGGKYVRDTGIPFSSKAICDQNCQC